MNKKLISIISILMLVSVLSVACENTQNTAIQKDNSTQTQEEKNVSEVKASHILVATEEEAKKLKAEIKDAESFAKAAQKSSKCPSGKQGGDLGYFGKGMMVPAFEEAAFSLEPNTVSDPIQTQFGWHLIMVTDKR